MERGRRKGTITVRGQIGRGRSTCRAFALAKATMLECDPGAGYLWARSRIADARRFRPRCARGRRAGAGSHQPGPDLQSAHGVHLVRGGGSGGAKSRRPSGAGEATAAAAARGGEQRGGQRARRSRRRRSRAPGCCCSRSAAILGFHRLGGGHARERVASRRAVLAARGRFCGARAREWEAPASQRSRWPPAPRHGRGPWPVWRWYCAAHDGWERRAVAVPLALATLAAVGGGSGREARRAAGAWPWPADLFIALYAVAVPFAPPLCARGWRRLAMGALLFPRPGRRAAGGCWRCRCRLWRRCNSTPGLPLARAGGGGFGVELRAVWAGGGAGGLAAALGGETVMVDVPCSGFTCCGRAVSRVPAGGRLIG